MSSPRKLNILITGCSPGGMGAALATVFHDAGHHVYATARNPSKLAPLAAQGMRTIPLDVTSASSIQSAVEAVSSSLFDGEGLDMLVNNAAGSYTMPIADVSLDAARALFDQNVWAQIAVTQAFLPLLLKSATALTRSSRTTSSGPARAMVVNHTSVGSVAALPFQGVYNASKAALAMLSETMRLELAPFGIGVVDLKTAGVRTNIISNNNVNTRAEGLPADSIYGPAREVVEKAMSQKGLAERGVTAEQWAAEVAALLLGKNPPAVIWKGESAMVARVASSMPCNMFEGFIKKMTKLDVVEELITESRR
ncbi:Putative short-chain dehydrogenase/reductase SDR, NAD(P)-binding domain superfamily [Colletotrichum destructivum]|uniref:Short-chain dehydrogenase/reductase SDR, NAD(P)-binding domain superfamily n=1 Tax=Colletotrichum destructivum TaxID=34406 RepID=A0AAX4IC92_9PEZI|nr:Putative short-chain dehydrogenase/reductase SDR, NAD(P)-binding domain superfamily [Colletotrichum destructivum]